MTIVEIRPGKSACHKIVFLGIGVGPYFAEVKYKAIVDIKYHLNWLVAGVVLKLSTPL